MPDVAVVGAGPAGLMAAEMAASAGCRVVVYERMPRPARKFLMAGRGGLNLTHTRPLHDFLATYRDPEGHVARAVAAFPPEALIAWCRDLGIETRVGTSGRVFPVTWKASPLLRSWLRRLDAAGVTLKAGHNWTGWDDDGALVFETAQGPRRVRPNATILALGGASWPRLGSNGAWLETMAAADVATRPWAPSNCGLVIEWSAHVVERWAGAPLKRIAVRVAGTDAWMRGEAVITRTGLEGGAIYALGAQVRDALAAPGPAVLELDLRPDFALSDLSARLATAPGKQSLATVLRKRAGLQPQAAAVLRDGADQLDRSNPQQMASAIKAVRLSVTGLQGLDRAISSVGGVAGDAIGSDMMLKARPGTFVAGEMFDWDAPTGGFLLQACFATGRVAGTSAAAWAALCGRGG